jgi:hypothetical protein
MNRRRSLRHSRRLQVQFWQPGEEVRRGVTTNVSATGMHIATIDPLPPASRVRIEVVHGAQGFLVEGVVAHRRSVHPELTRVAVSGMGVRLLMPDELIAELLPSGVSPSTLSDTHDLTAMRRPSRPGSSAQSLGDLAAPFDDPAAAFEPSESESGGARDTGTFRESSAYFSVRFPSVKDFLQTYSRDIANGGLFISTSRPGQLHEVVQIAIHPPVGSGEPVIADARIVQRFDPNARNGSILVGMGVELLELPVLMMRLQPIVDRIKKPT